MCKAFLYSMSDNRLSERTPFKIDMMHKSGTDDEDLGNVGTSEKRKRFDWSKGCWMLLNFSIAYGIVFILFWAILRFWLNFDVRFG